MPDRETLKQYRSLPLDAKVAMSYQRIREWYDYWNGNVYVAFSGGKDSTVLAHLVHEFYPDVPLVFVNTGLEYPEIQSFARKMGAEFIKPKMRFDEVISTYGYPIISKENSEAIYYARRILNIHGGARQKTRADYRRENFTNPAAGKNSSAHGGRDNSQTSGIANDQTYKRTQLMGGGIWTVTRRKQVTGQVKPSDRNDGNSQRAEKPG